MAMQANHQNRLNDAATIPDGLLPEHWPAQPGPPRVRPVWIPWLIAVALAPLFWLMPRRFGPHFAAAGWRAAVAAHLLWGIYGTATLTLTLLTEARYGLITWLAGRTPEQMGISAMPVATFSEIVRAPLAFWVDLLCESQGPSGVMAAPSSTFVPVLFISLMVAAGIVLLGLLLMPYITAGERTRLLWGRTVRLVMWATTSFVLLGWGMQVLVLTKHAQEWAFILVTLAYTIWAISLIIRGGARYAGPAEGPAWQERVPVCTDCGYTLTALPLAGACPECGLAVTESLPDRRQPSVFASAQSVRARMTAYTQTCRAVLADRTFFRRLQMEDGLPAARRFAVCTCGLTSLVMGWLLFLCIDIWGYAMHGHALTTGEYANLLIMPASLGLVFLLLLGAVALLASRFGWRDIRRSAIPVFYWSIWLLAVGTCFLLVLMLIGWLEEKAFFSYRVHVGILGEMDLYDVPVALLLVIPSVLLFRALVRLVQALRNTRHANR